MRNAPPVIGCLAGLCFVGLIACAPGDAESWEPLKVGGETSPGAGPSRKHELKIVTPEFDIPEGESLECFYTDVIPEEDLSVVSAASKQGPGGHHVLVYYSDTVRDPEHHPCDDAEMVSWHQVVGANAPGSGEPAIVMPEGLAIKVPAGKQIVLQAHYVNTTGKSQRHRDEVAIALTEPDNLIAYANLFAVGDIGFALAPHTLATRVTRTTVKRDVQLVLLGGHMHEHGQRFKLEVMEEPTAENVDAGEDDVKDVLYNEQWSEAYVSHPPMLRYTPDTPFLLKKGTRLRQTCVWDNTSPETITFPGEMCITFGFYFPDEGEMIHLSKPD